MAKQRKKRNSLDKCARWAKSVYTKWPSAYASGAAVKCRKGKAGPNKKKGKR